MKYLLGILVIFMTLQCKTTESSQTLDRPLSETPDNSPKLPSPDEGDLENAPEVSFTVGLQLADYIELKSCRAGACQVTSLDDTSENTQILSDQDDVTARACKQDGGGSQCGDWVSVNDGEHLDKSQKKWGMDEDNILVNGVKIDLPMALGAAGAVAAGAGVVVGGTLLVRLKMAMNKRAHFVYELSKGGEVFKVRFAMSGWPSPSPGLVTDHNMFLDALKSKGYTVKKLEKFSPDKMVDLNIHLEHVGRVDNGKKNWMLANQEFFRNSHPGQIDQYFCRHADCASLVKSKLGPKFEGRVQQINFTSQVKGKVEGLDYQRFFHPAGKSHFKNTDLLVRAWLANPDLPELVITCRNITRFQGCLPELKRQGLYDQILQSKNIKLYEDFIPDEDFQKVAKIGNVIMPSQAEGFGHSLNEARGKGQIVLTLDADPMKSMIEDGVNGFKVKAKQSGSFGNGAPKYAFDQNELVAKVREMQLMNSHQRAEMSQKAVDSFEADKQKFFTSFSDQMESVRVDKLKVGDTPAPKKSWFKFFKWR